MSISESETGKKDWPISQDLWNLPRDLAVFCRLSETWCSLMSDNPTVVINTSYIRLNTGHLPTRVGINHCCLEDVVLSLSPSKYICGEWFCRRCVYFNDWSHGQYAKKIFSWNSGLLSFCMYGIKIIMIIIAEWTPYDLYIDIIMV